MFYLVVYLIGMAITLAIFLSMVPIHQVVDHKPLTGSDYLLYGLATVLIAIFWPAILALFIYSNLLSLR